MRKLWIAGALLLAVAQAQGAAHTGPQPLKREPVVTVVHAGTLLADPSGEPVREVSVIIDTDRVREVVSGYVDPATLDAGKARVELIDLSDQFVLPGMFDSHVHLARATGAYSGGFAAANSRAPAGQATVNAMINAQLNLAAGFTALRDLGSDSQSVFAVRDSINLGHVTGPAIIASGPSVSPTAGHGDKTTSEDPDVRAEAGVCDGADECRTLIRHLEKTGANLIKFKATGGFSSNTGLKPHMSEAEVRSIIDTAHQRKIRATTHAYAPDSIRMAVQSGVDSVEHGYLVDDAGLKLMRKNGTFLVPTLIVAEPPGMVKRFLQGREPISVTLRNENRAFERAYERGVKIAFGTDVGIYPHGRNADELVRMVELGMTPADAIESATVVAAELFGLEGMNGRIEAGGVADLIAVDGDPLADISELQDVGWVIKSGQVVKRAGVVQAPLNYALPQRY